MTNQSQNQSPHHLVLSLDVTGGFLAGAEMEFADGLNCLIGGRGAGKTTALEFLRFGLGLMPDSKGEFAAVSGDRRSRRNSRRMRSVVPGPCLNNEKTATATIATPIVSWSALVGMRSKSRAPMPEPTIVNPMLTGRRRRSALRKDTAEPSVYFPGYFLMDRSSRLFSCSVQPP